VIVNSVRSALQADYPDLQVIVVDDGSTDMTLNRLVQSYGLVKMDGTCHPASPRHTSAPITSIRRFPTWWLSAKCGGGSRMPSMSALTSAAHPTFCNLDADCLLERDALLRLMDPIVNSALKPW